MSWKTAYSVWKEEVDAGVIVTLCKDIDDAIGGGIRIGSITELVGSPGAGKTQFCLQLCVNVQIPKNLSGQEGGAIFIDTNRGFSINRIGVIANATKTHCDRFYRKSNIKANSNFTTENMLNNIHGCFCNSYVDLSAVVYTLDTFLENNSNVRLIVIDSFSYLFRTFESDDMVQVTHEILMKLQSIARKFRCAVVITNELTTRVGAIDNETVIVPALGDSHSHRVNTLISLCRDFNYSKLFIANIDKCFSHPERKVPFLITNDGVRPYRKPEGSALLGSQNDLSPQ